MELKVAVISGGAGGIGNAVVLRLQRDGFFTVILDVNEAAGRDTLKKVKESGGEADFIAVDITRKHEVQKTFSSIILTLGRIDVLVNLAGGTLHAKLIQDFPLREWREVIDVNLKGTFLCCQAAIDVMKRQGKGSIVNTSSNFGITGSPRRTAYSASKAAVIALAKSLALEMAPFGIRVNTIAPGLTATKRVMSHSSAAEWARLCEAIPMRRAADPSDIAEGVAFLAGEESSCMTGQTLHVNGGVVLP